MNTMDNKKVTENKRLRASHNKTVDTDTVLGSGKVTAILGKGGFATVYEIWNPKLEIKRAVKLWHPDISDKSLERFETEIKITAKLQHPNIVEIHNVGEWNGIPYIEMEIIDGYCLKEILSETGAFPTEVASAICILICRALTYAHRQNYVLYGVQRKGIVHCDIKPANIMITRQGVVKLTDFGLATPTDETLHTEEDKVNGSIHYSSPEQLQSVQVDERTDIYSLGVVMYELFSGKKAFSGKNLSELVHKRLNDTYVPFHEICHDINPAVKKIVRKCMAFDRDDRYSSAQELLVDIEKSYYKTTKESPEYVISHFFSNPKRKKTKKHGLLQTSLIALATISIAILLLVVFYPNGFNFSIIKDKLTGKDSGNDVLSSPDAQNWYQSESKLTNSNTLSNNNNNDSGKSISSKKRPLSTLKNDKRKSVRESTSKNLKQSSTFSSGNNYSNALSTDTILHIISSAVQKKDYTKAAELFRIHSIDDGEYYSLYANYLCNKGRWQDALSYVEKGFKTPSRRLSTEQRRILYMSGKARCLTAAFDQSGTKEQGEKAMEAWFDLKYILKGMPSTPQFEYADSEIRRINKVLQNDLSN